SYRRFRALFMNSEDIPGFYDDLSLSLDEVRRLLGEGTINRRVPAHHPVVASVDTDGNPSQRIMILRDFNWEDRQMRFNTDRRSTKVAQLENLGNTSILIYDEAAKLQIRLAGTARVDSQQEAEAAWRDSTPFARRCYMSEAAPGDITDNPSSGLPGWIESKKPSEEQLAPARANFAVVIVSIYRIEWLYLANSGHRRAQWQWDETANTWSGRWLIP
ncbi:MAG: pyridoxamine 5'-phosphate oxidase family protein, partial [Sphingorhabdus sp.]